MAGAGVAAIVILVGALGLVFGGDDSDGDDSDGSDTAGPATSATEPAPVETAEQAFVVAADQLDEGGSFRYSGRFRAGEPSALHPTTVADGRIIAHGEVILPRRVRQEMSDGSAIVQESIIVGSGSWERTRSLDDDPKGATPYGEGRRGSLDMGAALLPTWLRAATDVALVDDVTKRPLSVDDDARVFGGTLVLAEVDGPLPIYITLDRDDVLRHVSIGSRDGPFSIYWDIGRIGSDFIPIEAPGPLPDAAVDVTSDDVVAAGIGDPVQLTEVPEGWVLAGAELVPAALGEECTTLELDYTNIDTLRPPDLEIDVRSDDCVPALAEADDSEDAEDDDAVVVEEIVVGDWSGDIRVSTGRCTGSVSNGDTTIDIRSDLDLETTGRLLESLGPYDPAVQPDEIDIR